MRKPILIAVAILAAACFFCTIGVAVFYLSQTATVTVNHTDGSTTSVTLPVLVERITLQADEPGVAVTVTNNSRYTLGIMGNFESVSRVSSVIADGHGNVYIPIAPGEAFTFAPTGDVWFSVVADE